MGNSRIHCYENKEIMTDVRKGYEYIKFSYEAVASFNLLKFLGSKFEFSFVAPIHFPQKHWGEIDKVSSKFILCHHVCNSHDHSVLQSIDITRGNSVLITLTYLSKPSAFSNKQEPITGSERLPY